MNFEIKIDDLKLNDIENLTLGDTLKIESNEKKLCWDIWGDVPDKLEELFKNNIADLWRRSFGQPVQLNLNKKVYELWHGNTKIFSLTRIK